MINNGSGTTELSRVYADATHTITVYSPLDSAYPYYEIKVTRPDQWSGNSVIRVTKWSSM